MSAEGISSSLANYSNQPVSYERRPIPNVQQFRAEFQQLGEDLQSGNLSAAQSDFAALQKIGPPGLSNPSLQPNNPLSHAFAQFAQDLQSGNLSAAQQDYSKIQQVFQNQAERVQGHRHHHGGGESSEAQPAATNSISVNA